MPELPEVETVVRDLRPLVEGAVIRGVRLSEKRLRKPWNAAWTGMLLDQRLEQLSRRGKWIVANLSNGGRLVIHLGMTGQLQVMPASHALADHLHLTLDLDEDKQLRFRDIRRFGSASWFPDQAALDQEFVESGLGPEPFGLDPHHWRKALAKTSRCLKAILLDQTVVAGVGNIYADESLFQARLYPGIKGCDLTKAGVDRLREAIAEVLTRAIEQRGSSIRNYVGGSGLQGSFQNEFSVYGRTEAPCPRCQTPIVRIRLAGRSTHFCPRCQAAADNKAKRKRSRI